jgi:hypothetical protein
VSATLVKKDWTNIIDYSVGNNGTTLVNPSAPPDPYLNPEVELRLWYNEPLAERTYSGLELVTDYTYDNFHFYGNVTWSTLEGNYQGESTNSPGTGDGLSFYRIYHGEEMYKTRDRSPYGRLSGDKPMVIHALADYTVRGGFGTTVFGFIYTLESGNVYSFTRPLTMAAWNPALVGTGAGTAFSQYMDDERTHGRFNTSVYHDLAVTHDFNLFKVGNTQVSAFAKLIIYNFFNHQQQLSWTVPALRAELPNGSTLGTATARDQPWTTVGTTYGAITNTNYGAARSFAVSLGLRF